MQRFSIVINWAVKFSYKLLNFASVLGVFQLNICKQLSHLEISFPFLHQIFFLGHKAARFSLSPSRSSRAPNQVWFLESPLLPFRCFLSSKIRRLKCYCLVPEIVQNHTFVDVFSLALLLLVLCLQGLFV